MATRFLRRTTIANVVSAFCIAAGLVFFIYIRNTEGVMFVVGSAVGYLYGRQQQRQE